MRPPGSTVLTANAGISGSFVASITASKPVGNCGISLLVFLIPIFLASAIVCSLRPTK